MVFYQRHRFREDEAFRLKQLEHASNAGKIGGRKGADARIKRMKEDPAFAAEVRAKMSASIKTKWEERKRRVACPSYAIQTEFHVGL